MATAQQDLHSDIARKSHSIPSDQSNRSTDPKEAIAIVIPDDEVKEEPEDDF